MEFRKGRKKTGGRKAGTPNEATERKSKAFRKGPESACILSVSGVLPGAGNFRFVNDENRW